MSGILARRQLRLAAKQAISAFTGVTVESPGDWESQPVNMPSIKLRCPMERKQSLARTMPEFTTTVTLELLARVVADTEDAAQDAIEALGQAIEQAVFGSVALVRLCQQFSTVTTETDISADGKKHFGGIKLSIDCELFESFDPTEINPADYPAAQKVAVHVDTAQPFDATGIYPSPAFPASVPPAPRTTGPDGRDEGYLEINLP